MSKVREKEDDSQWVEKVISWEDMEEEKINLAYENATSLLIDIEQAQKSLENKALFFLSYLLTVVGTLLYHFLFKRELLLKSMLPNNVSLYQCTLVLIIYYLVTLILTTLKFLSPRKQAPSSVQPREILLSSEEKAHDLKKRLCIGLQEAIDFNTKDDKDRAFYLKISLSGCSFSTLWVVMYIALPKLVIPPLVTSFVVATVITLILLGVEKLSSRSFP